MNGFTITFASLVTAKLLFKNIIFLKNKFLGHFLIFSLLSCSVSGFFY